MQVANLSEEEGEGTENDDREEREGERSMKEGRKEGSRRRR